MIKRSQPMIKRSNLTRTVTAPGLAVIKTYEGLKLRLYLCPANKATIGYGHVLLPKFDAALFGLTPDALTRIIDDCERRRALTREAKQLNAISPEQADALLAKDAQLAADAVNSLTGVALSQAQFDALVSFVFNIGHGNYAKSTMRKKLKASDYAAAADEFERWVFGGGKRLAGLAARRKDERDLFLSIV